MCMFFTDALKKPYQKGRKFGVNKKEWTVFWSAGLFHFLLPWCHLVTVRIQPPEYARAELARTETFQIIYLYIYKMTSCGIWSQWRD